MKLLIKKKYKIFQHKPNFPYILDTGPLMQGLPHDKMHNLTRHIKRVLVSTVPNSLPRFRWIINKRSYLSLLRHPVSKSAVCINLGLSCYPIHFLYISVRMVLLFSTSHMRKGNFSYTKVRRYRIKFERSFDNVVVIYEIYQNRKLNIGFSKYREQPHTVLYISAGTLKVGASLAT